MYYYLNGKLALADENLAVIDCGGVGYKCAISKTTYLGIRNEKEVKLFTHLNVKEDALDLYGFATELELKFFTLLTSVSGIGPKVALALLSEMPPEELAAAVLASDAKRITRTPGVGPKVAQRLCLELKDKISKIGSDIAMDGISGEYVSQPTEAVSEAVSVLIALGYGRSDAENALKKCSAENTEDLVRQALRLLNRLI